MIRLKSLVLLLIGVSINYSYGQTIQITVEGVRNKNGCIQLAVFDSDINFKNENPIIEKTFKKNFAKSGVLNIEFDLKPGNYGIAILDDENSDGKMDYNLIGIPVEGFGFSNFNSSGLRKPKFKNFSFDVNSGINLVYIKMRYVL